MVPCTVTSHNDGVMEEELILHHEQGEDGTASTVVGCNAPQQRQ